MLQEDLRPGFVRAIGKTWFALVSGRHAKKISHAHRLEVVRWILRGIVGKELQHFVIDAQLAFSDGDPDRSRSKALAERVKRVWNFRRVRRPPAFGYDMAVADEHKTVHCVHLFVRGFDKLANGRGPNALRLRSAAWQATSGTEGR